jgi:hypothetical protein
MSCASRQAWARRQRIAARDLALALFFLQVRLTLGVLARLPAAYAGRIAREA